MAAINKAAPYPFSHFSKAASVFRRKPSLTSFLFLCPLPPHPHTIHSHTATAFTSTITTTTFTTINTNTYTTATPTTPTFNPAISTTTFTATTFTTTPLLRSAIWIRGGWGMVIYVFPANRVLSVSLPPSLSSLLSLCRFPLSSFLPLASYP